MWKVLEDKECINLMLRIILDKEDLVVNKSFMQYDLKNLYGHSLRLDVYAQDSNGTLFNIEIQRSNNGASPERARYHCGLIDMNTLKAGESFKSLPETYVIFITENDVLGNNLPIYHIERTILETDKSFNDKSHIIYVNAQIQDETKLGKLMHDIMCPEPNEMNYTTLSDRVRYFKENTKGVTHMCELMEKFLYESNQETIELTRKETKTQTETDIANNLLRSGKLSIEEIASMTNLDINKVKELAQNISK
jgi:predicted transposase/invertase (TIGR01784 family)